MQKPHCRPWHSANACCTGPSEPSALVSPSTVVISAVDRRDREHQARPHRPPVDQHGAGAADAVLAADVGAGQAEVVAQRVGEQPPRGHARLVGDAVDAQPDVVQLLGHCAASAPLDDPAGQHPHQLGAVGGGGVDVVGGVELLERGVAQAPRSATPVRSTTVGTSLTER